MTTEELQRLINKMAMEKAQVTLGINFGDILTRAELVNGSTYVSGFLDCAKLIPPLIAALDQIKNNKDLNYINSYGKPQPDFPLKREGMIEIAKEALENFEKELGNEF